MNDFLTHISEFNYNHTDIKLNKRTSEVLAFDDKKEAAEFLDFLLVFSSGYGKFMKQKTSVFHSALNIWIVKMHKLGFSYRTINNLCSQSSYKL